MLLLVEIKRAADSLPQEQQQSLLKWLAGRVQQPGINSPSNHSVLDIPPVSLGGMICPTGPGEDLLGEMLEGR